MAILKFLNRNSDQKEGEEMPFIEHLEVLRWHLVRSVIAIVIFTILAAYYMRSIIYPRVILGPTKPDFITYRALCKLGKTLNIPDLCLSDFKISFQNLEVSGQFMAHFTTSAYVGIILAFPYIFYEVWKFVKPALSTKELHTGNRLIFWVVLLFGLGLSFAYFIIVPYTVQFFTTYQLDPSIKNEFTIDNYISLILNLTVGTGIIFLLPIFIYFFSKIGIITPTILRKSRKIAFIVVLIIAGIITPPDVFSQIMVTIPIMLLYEVSIMISARIYKEKQAEEKALYD